MGAVAEGRPDRELSPEGFYVRESMGTAERLDFARARQMEGLAEEIAALRVALKKLLAETSEEQPERLKLALRGMDMLVKAVAAQYRLSPRARKDLADNFAAVMNSLGDHLLPTGR